MKCLRSHQFASETACIVFFQVYDKNLHQLKTKSILILNELPFVFLLISMQRKLKLIFISCIHIIVNDNDLFLYIQMASLISMTYYMYVAFFCYRNLILSATFTLVYISFLLHFCFSSQNVGHFSISFFYLIILFRLNAFVCVMRIVGTGTYNIILRLHIIFRYYLVLFI